MPVYVYEHVYDHCPISGDEFEVIQGLHEDPLDFCPGCGLEVRRIVGPVSIRVRPGFDPEKAAKRGFTTWRKSGAGQWEKVAGQGVDAIVGAPEDIEAVKKEKGG
ncbi:MAG: zinc ribbon domain-containing protein [Fimbriimonadaceae bacterium]|nr:zinc ribbon domain-containing protein [Fimbriimonadaceae bacterium]QYK59472.1 MAG: zinc ribbon domain-containing protein [Fimbriimonadaceae bacterium]